MSATTDVLAYRQAGIKAGLPQAGRVLTGIRLRRTKSRRNKFQKVYFYTKAINRMKDHGFVTN